MIALNALLAVASGEFEPIPPTSSASRMAEVIPSTSDAIPSTSQNSRPVHQTPIQSSLRPENSPQNTVRGQWGTRRHTNFNALETIGRGAYGEVYKAKDLQSNEIIAMKKMTFKLTEDGVPMAILREISLLRHLSRLDHPNIVRLLDITYDVRSERNFMVMYLIFEYFPQDLKKYIEECPPPGLEQERIKDIMFQITNGVDFLHANRIVHRDLKPQNLLVSSNGRVKITDFGLARIYEFYTLLTTTVVTLWYRAPEVLMSTGYDTRVDVWSLGCIFAELITQKPLFEGQKEKEQLEKIFEVVGLPEKWPENAVFLQSNFAFMPKQAFSQVIPGIEPQAEDLLEKMLNFERDERISASMALSHPYFEGLTPVPHNSCDYVRPPTHEEPKNSAKRKRASPSALNSSNFNTVL